MAAQTFKNIIVAGASGTIGAPITAALLSQGDFTVSALTRPSSTATFPPNVLIKRADLTSHAQLVEAFQGQDVVICALNDEAGPLQLEIIEAAYEAGVRRFLVNEWANHDMTVAGTPLEEVFEGKKAVIEHLNGLVKRGESEGKEFHWTGINNGVFFDWALHAVFLDITIPPTGHTAKIWDAGTNKTTCTTLSTVCAAVIAILTTSEKRTHDRLINIQSFAASPLEIVAALEKASGEKWEVEFTTTEKELEIAGGKLEEGEFLEAYYRWIKSFMFGERSRLEAVENEMLGLGEETLEGVVERVLRGQEV